MEAHEIINRKNAMIIVGGEVISSHDIVVNVVMKEDIIPEKLFASYRLFILDNPSLASKWNETENRAFWSPFTQNELNKLLDLEKVHFSGCHDSNTLYSQYYSTNSRLPFRMTMTNARTLVFFVHHAIANGKSAIAWIERWINFYFHDEHADLKKTSTVNVNCSGRMKSFENLTFAYSPIGIIKEPLLVDKAESVCIYINCQNIYISSATFHNRLCFHVSVPNEFFDKNNIYEITDRIFTREYMISM